MADTHLIHQSNETFAVLLGTVIFATLDFNSRYWQINIGEEDIMKTPSTFTG